MQSCSWKGKSVFLVYEKGGIKLEVGKRSRLCRELHWDQGSKTMSSLEVHLCIWEQQKESRKESHKQYRSWGRSQELRMLRSLRSLGGNLVITNIKWRGYQRAQAISALIIHFGNIYCSISTAEPAGFPQKTGLPAPSGEALTPDENRHWNTLSVLAGHHITAELFSLPAEKDCQERLIILPVLKLLLSSLVPTAKEAWSTREWSQL